MRDRFQEFYYPSGVELKRFLTEGTVVLDTNILLSLYRFSAQQREDVLMVLGSIGDRLWIPYQVGMEYQRGRMAAIRRQAGKFESLIDLLGIKDVEQLTSTLDDLDFDESISSTVRPHLQAVAPNLKVAAEEYATFAKKIRATHIVDPDGAATVDPVRDALDDLFAGRVGPKPDDETKAHRLEEAEKRARLRIPPGYKDDKKDDPERRAGDYFLWAELLDYAKETAGDSTPFLLITDDVKEDWYARSGGKQIGPRPELAREFAQASTAGYHQITLSELLTLANQHLSSDVDANTIAKASRFSEESSEEEEPETQRSSERNLFLASAVERMSQGDPRHVAIRRAAETLDPESEARWAAALRALSTLSRERAERLNQRVAFAEQFGYQPQSELPWDGPSEYTSARARQAVRDAGARLLPLWPDEDDEQSGEERLNNRPNASAQETLDNPAPNPEAPPPRDRSLGDRDVPES